MNETAFINFAGAIKILAEETEKLAVEIEVLSDETEELVAETVVLAAETGGMKYARSWNKGAGLYIG